MSLSTLAYLLLIHTSRCILQQQQSQGYDVDCNGIPDWCYAEGYTVHCLQNDDTWTSFHLTSTIRCTNTIASSGVSSAPSVSLISANRTTQTSSPIATHPAPPHPTQFAKDKGHKWKIEPQGNLRFPGSLEDKNLNGDKCRTGKIGDKVVWNCGDMQCGKAWQICGFSMGPAFYGTDDVMAVDTININRLQDNEFVRAWHRDAQPEYPQFVWGMDTSNVAPINDTHGVAFAWQTWRGSADGAHVDRGHAVAAITLGEDRPIAERRGPLLTGPERVALGLLAILRVEESIYTYSIGGPSNVIIGRVAANDSVFHADQHEFLQYGSNGSWTRGIPYQNTTEFGATTANLDSRFGCSVYGSIFYNTYLEKYIMLCDIYMLYINMYTSDTPHGPWSEEYQITSVGSDGLVPGSYGSMAHPEYWNGKEWYLSIGPNSIFQVFKVTFDY